MPALNEGMLLEHLRPKKAPPHTQVNSVALTAQVFSFFGAEPRYRETASSVAIANAGGMKQITSAYLRPNHALIAIPADQMNTVGAFKPLNPLVVPVMIGVNRLGWHRIDQATFCDEADNPSDWFWCLCRIGKPILELPPFLRFDQYDIGHEVVVAVGESMGERSTVQAIHNANYTLATGRSHRGECLGAVRTGSVTGDLALAPLEARLSPGQPCWVLVEGVWQAAVVGEYRQGAVGVLLLDSGEPWAAPRSRHLVRERHDGTPPESPRRRAPVPVSRWARARAASAMFDEAERLGKPILNLTGQQQPTLRSSTDQDIQFHGNGQFELLGNVNPRDAPRGSYRIEAQQIPPVVHGVIGAGGNPLTFDPGEAGMKWASSLEDLLKDE